jgi:outer membrane receptor protein involved in Fe transport
MNYRKNAGFLGLVTALMAGSALMPTSAHAQSVVPNAADQADAGIGDIIVTANKRAQSINDVGLTITALGGDTLERQGVRNLDDLARSVPGLTYAGTDFGTPIFTLRGVGFYDVSLGGYPTTSVYLDEVPLPFPAMAAHTNLDLERVEVLKGPQGTLFGQNSTGGAINFVAAKPTDALAAGIDVTVGRFGQGEATGYISGPVTDTLGIRLAGQYGYGSPWQRSYTRDDSLGKRNFLNGRMLVNWEPTSNLKISLNLNGWRDRSDPQAPQFKAIFPQVAFGPVSLVHPDLAVYPFAPNDPRAADWSPDHRPHADKRQYQGSLRGDLNLTDNIVLTSITSYVHYRVSQQLDNDGTTLEEFQYRDYGTIKSFTQELRLAGGEGTSFRWVLGSNLEESKTHELTFQYYGQSTIRNLSSRAGSAFTNQDIRNYAFFANGEYDIVPGVTFKAGARYTNSRINAELCTRDAGDGSGRASFPANYARLNPGAPIPVLLPGQCSSLLPNLQPGLFVDTLKDNNVSWRVGVDYKPSRDLLLYANVSKGYKGGSYPVIGTTIYTSYLPVKAESLLDYEAGFKAQLLDRKLGINGAVFYYDYTDKQLLTKRRDVIAGLIPRLENVPKSRVKGAELELNAEPVEGLRLSGGVTYLDASITKYVGVNAGGATADFAGTVIPFTPKWQYVANADYSVPVGGPIRPFVGATLTGRTGTTSIVGSAEGAIIRAGYRSSIPIAEMYDIPAYTLLDLRAGVEAEDGTWRLMVWGKNVTNKYYWQNVTSAFEGVSRYAGQPATYGVTFGHKFGR